MKKWTEWDDMCKYPEAYEINKANHDNNANDNNVNKHILKRNEIEKMIWQDMVRISGNISSESEFQYNKTDVRFAISRAITETAKALLDETLGVIEREYVDYDPHHSGYAINKIDFGLLKEEIKKKWLK